MTLSLKHEFACLIADDPADLAAGKVMQQAHWGAEHVLTQATARLLGRVTAGSGVTEELTATQAKTLLAISASDVSGLGSAALASTLAFEAAGTVAAVIALYSLASLGSAAYTSASAYDASGAASSAVAAHAALQNVHGLAITAGKTLTVSNSLTLSATDGSTLAIGGGGTLGTAAYTAASAYEVPLTFSTGLTRSTNTITVNTSQNIAKLSNLTGNGYLKTSGGDGTLSASATVAVADLSAAIDLSATGAGGATGVLAAGRFPALTGDVTSVAGALATTLATVNSNVGSFGSATTSLTVTVNAKGLVTAMSAQTVTPAVGSITGLGTGVATWLATPSSANLAAALTDESGSGALVFAASPTLTGTPNLATPIADAYKISSTAVVTDATTARTLSASDNGLWIVFTSSSAITVSMASGLGAGFACKWTAAGAGQITFAANGQTMNSYGGLVKSAGQYAEGTVSAKAANDFIISGALA